MIDYNIIMSEVNSKEISTKKIYIGFSVDMDRAYSMFTLQGKPVRKDHPKYNDRLKHQANFLNGIKNLLTYFKELGVSHSVTWYVNESGYGITRFFPEVMANIVNSGGEIALHTHFNSRQFAANDFFMSDDPEVWYQRGIKDAKQTVEKAVEAIIGKPYQIVSFKAGDHIRNNAMYDYLIKDGFKYDSSAIYEYKRYKKDGNKEYCCVDDLDLKIENGPFYRKSSIEKDKSILIIPEIHDIGLIIKKLPKVLDQNGRAFVRFMQVHPWEVAGDWDPKNLDDYRTYTKRVIDICQKYSDQIEFKTLKEMGNVNEKS